MIMIIVKIMGMMISDSDDTDYGACGQMRIMTSLSMFSDYYDKVDLSYVYGAFYDYDFDRDNFGFVIGDCVAFTTMPFT